jgi:hypothetical protein
MGFSRYTACFCGLLREQSHNSQIPELAYNSDKISPASDSGVVALQRVLKNTFTCFVNKDFQLHQERATLELIKITLYDFGR